MYILPKIFLKQSSAKAKTKRDGTNLSPNPAVLAYESSKCKGLKSFAADANLAISTLFIGLRFFFGKVCPDFNCCQCMLSPWKAASNGKYASAFENSFFKFDAGGL